MKISTLFTRHSYSVYSRMTAETINSSEFIERRAHLLKLIAQTLQGNELRKNIFILLLSHPKTFSAPDVPHVYRQCSHFRYLSGLGQPQTKLLIGPKETVYFTENQTEHQVLWEGPTYTEAEVKQISGIEKVLPMSEFQDYMVGTVRDGILAFDQNSLIEGAHRELDLKKIYQMLTIGAWTHVPLFDKIDQLRWRKSKCEQELMRESARIGSEALNAMIRNSRGIRNESHIVGYLEHQCRLRGANFLAYPPVVAGGPNANTIHYISSNTPIKANNCVLVDSGCDYQGYVSDITRCFPSSGAFSAPQKAAYDALCDLHNQLLQYVRNKRPLRLNELYHFMLERMAESLNSIVFFKKDLNEEELIRECDKLCPHHVSHYLGMDVHDTPSISRSIECKPGVVITVEPGIYVRSDNAAVREEFKGIGFRIEDDVLLTDTGAEVLTSNCIRETREIEFAMSI